MTSHASSVAQPIPTWIQGRLAASRSRSACSAPLAGDQGDSMGTGAAWSACRDRLPKETAWACLLFGGESPFFGLVC